MTGASNTQLPLGMQVSYLCVNLSFATSLIRASPCALFLVSDINRLFPSDVPSSTPEKVILKVSSSNSRFQKFYELKDVSREKRRLGDKEAGGGDPLHVLCQLSLHFCLHGSLLVSHWIVGFEVQLKR